MVSFTDEENTAYLQTLSCDCDLTSCTGVSESFTIPSQTQTSAKYAWYKLAKSGNTYLFSPYTNGVTVNNAEWPFSQDKIPETITGSVDSISYEFDCFEDAVEGVVVSYENNAIHTFFKEQGSTSTQITFKDVLSSISNNTFENISCDGDSSDSSSVRIGKNNIISDERIIKIFPNTQEEREYSYGDESLNFAVRNLAFADEDYSSLSGKILKITINCGSDEISSFTYNLSDETFFEPYENAETDESATYSEFNDLSVVPMILKATDNLSISFNPYIIDSNNSTNLECTVVVSLLDSDGTLPSAVNKNLLIDFNVSLSLKSKTRKRFIVKSANSLGIESQFTLNDDVLFTKFGNNVLITKIETEYSRISDPDASADDEDIIVSEKRIKCYLKDEADFIEVSNSAAKTELFLQSSTSDQNADKKAYFRIGESFFDMQLSNKIDKCFLNNNNLILLFVPNQANRKIIKIDLLTLNWLDEIRNETNSSTIQLPNILCQKNFALESNGIIENCVLFGTASGLYLLNLTTLVCTHLTDSIITNSTAINTMFSYEDEFNSNRTIYCSIDDKVVSITISKDVETDSLILNSSIILQETEQNIIAILHNAEFTNSRWNWWIFSWYSFYSHN